MLLTEYRKEFFQNLASSYPETEIHSIFYLLTEEYVGVNRLDLALKPEIKLNEHQRSKLQEALRRLLNQEPVQYIIGLKDFFGLKFKVTPDVLIPRPETEELVEWIIRDNTGISGLRILDIGTGSGCIATSLSVNLRQVEMYAYDISEESLQVARENARLNNATVNFTKLDILTLDKLEKNFDIIVSNPPYVRDQEKKMMQNNVLMHEPEAALYVRDENALIFYEKIAKLAGENLPRGGTLYFEINQYLPEETSKLVAGFGFETELKKDIFGNFRMLKGTKKI